MHLGPLERVDVASKVLKYRKKTLHSFFLLSRNEFLEYVVPTPATVTCNIKMFECQLLPLKHCATLTTYQYGARVWEADLRWKEARSPSALSLTG